MGISIWQLLIILVIVLLLFGTKKLRNLGGDVGGAIKNFKQSMRSGEEGETPDSGEERHLRDDSQTQQSKPQSEKEKHHV